MLDRLLNNEFKGVFIDSRKPVQDGLFVPIIGEKFNGNSYILDAFQAGAKASLVERSYYEENREALAGLDLEVVDDTLLSLQHLARELLERLPVRVVGITGSNGKTTTKDLLESICQLHYKTYATKGNFNNEVGLPLTVLNIPTDTEILILEMGMNHAGEIRLLSELTKPDLAIITNIGTSHIEFFGSKEGIRDAKMEIKDFMAADAPLIVNADNELLDDYDYGEHRVIKAHRSDLKNVGHQDGYYHFTFHDQTIQLGIRGQHNVDNAHLALLTARELDIPLGSIKQGIEQYSGANMRFSVHKVHGVMLINDAYNASPLSMTSAIRTLLDMEGGRRIAVLGDIFELGKLARSEHESIGRIEEIHRLDGLFTIGDFSRYICPTHLKGRHFKNVNELNQFLLEWIKPGDIVLVKASRGMQLERIIQFLEENYHG